MTKIIAFSGRKQSGKSTSGDFLANFINQQHPNVSHKIYSFADPLKEDICMNILGLTYDQCYGSDDSKNTMTDLCWLGKQLTAREAMEIIGTDIFRKLKTSVWVDATINKILKEKRDIAIIVDCRFPNESNAILDNNGCVIRLDLDPFHSLSTSESALDADHYDWTRFTKVIHNHSMSIEEKNQDILKFIQSIQLI